MCRIIPMQYGSLSANESKSGGESPPLVRVVSTLRAYFSSYVIDTVLVTSC